MNRFRNKWASHLNEGGFDRPLSNNPSPTPVDPEEIIRSLCKAYALSYRMINDDSIEDFEATRYENLCKDIAEAVKNMYGPKSAELLRNAVRNFGRKVTMY